MTLGTLPIGLLKPGVMSDAGLFLCLDSTAVRKTTALKTTVVEDWLSMSD